MIEDVPDLELMVTRFNRLVKELFQGAIRRTTFQAWEVHLLLDLQECKLTRSRRDEALRRYQRVVQRQLERGELPPIRFAEFTAQKARKPVLVKAPPSAVAHDAPALNS